MKLKTSSGLSDGSRRSPKGLALGNKAPTLLSIHRGEHSVNGIIIIIIIDSCDIY